MQIHTHALQLRRFRSHEHRGLARSIGLRRLPPGCPARCFYCHNIGITTGIDIYPVATVVDLIQTARPFISGVIFSGGEATAQPDVLAALCKECKDRQLATGIHTNGMFPAVVQSLIDRNLIDKIALDVKTTWDLYPDVAAVDPTPIQETLDLCTRSYQTGC